ncbi:hypothetical protein [Leeuwenhoekiella sp. W20_SRS_FM14]|uniref:hypothetical protein n=1 Tax=Leeuwenhoekiella sp. W20_SRS_FM14 TaxID=3240270 RepID=UPI003F953926
MKNLILLFAFLMVLRPAFPFIEYLIDYDYISTILCENKEVPEMNCNGKCYLMKSLAEASEKESTQKKKNNSASVELLPFVVTDSSFDLSTDYLENTSVQFPVVSEFLRSQTSTSLFRPPII